MTSFLNSINIELENLIQLEYELNNDPVVPKKVVVRSSKRNNKTYYYQITSSSTKKQVYLGDASSGKLHALARSSYKKELLRLVKRNIKILKKALNDYCPYCKDDILAKLSPCLRTVQFDSNFDTIMEDLRKWASADYVKNQKPFQGPVILAKDGTRVRSKSECIIYNLLLDAGIPFRYDPVLKFRRKNAHGEYVEYVESPDFQIMCPDGSFILIEHAGLLNNPQYAVDLATKLQIYQLNGYFLGRDLFITSDTVDGGINSSQIESIIDLIRARFPYL
ncbi:MAG: hypothetical protein IKF07_07520 [Eubacterium sp.]|nr:hypothetical protein [Eubacterium sp.]